MNTQADNGSVSWQTSFHAYTRQYVLSFILVSLILVWRQTQLPVPSALWLIRSGMLQDLVAELPVGRQAAVSSFSFMPLTLLTALPFLLLLPSSAYGYAYLYGLAMILAFVVHPLSMMLTSAGAGRLRGVAILLPAVAASMIDPARYGDLLACFAMFALAFFFERRSLPEMRALAGVFWGLTLFAHAAGLLLLTLRLAISVISCARSTRSAEAKAVRWIQGVCAVYMILVYMFLNWMILGTPLHPLQTHRLRGIVGLDEATNRLEEDLKHHGLDAVPVVSGHWGYVIKPLLKARQGYHFIDFHPDKIAPGDNRDLVLVVPTPSNPLAVLADWRPYAPLSRQRLSPYLLLGRSRDWMFYLIDRKTEGTDG